MISSVECICRRDFVYSCIVESKALVEVYPLHIPDEQRPLRSEQLKKFYPVENNYERPDQLQQERQQQLSSYSNILALSSDIDRIDQCQNFKIIDQIGLDLAREKSKATTTAPTNQAFAGAGALRSTSSFLPAGSTIYKQPKVYHAQYKQFKLATNIYYYNSLKDAIFWEFIPEYERQYLQSVYQPYQIYQQHQQQQQFYEQPYQVPRSQPEQQYRDKYYPERVLMLNEYEILPPFFKIFRRTETGTIVSGRQIKKIFANITLKI
uniref:Uncharacterized protein n=1 Tax=Elaeophora elaphi TaxID=1147741 RepID=A0A0R3RRM3_9BILA